MFTVWKSGVQQLVTVLALSRFFLFIALDKSNQGGALWKVSGERARPGHRAAQQHQPTTRNKQTRTHANKQTTPQPKEPHKQPTTQHHINNNSTAAFGGSSGSQWYFQLSSQTASGDFDLPKSRTPLPNKGAEEGEIGKLQTRREEGEILPKSEREYVATTFLKVKNNFEVRAEPHIHTVVMCFSKGRRHVVDRK